jgi:hypothetical protein
MTYTELNEALEVFGFSSQDRLTLRQVKRRQRDLVKSAHPDIKSTLPAERIQQINAATSVLLEYLNSYRFSFSEEEFYRQNPDERLRMQFSNDPVWGGS